MKSLPTEGQQALHQPRVLEEAKEKGPWVRTHTQVGSSVTYTYAKVSVLLVHCLVEEWGRFYC